MKKYVSSCVLIIGFVFSLLIQSCGPSAPKIDPWERLQTANSISVVSVVTDDRLIEYAAQEEGRGKKKTIKY